MRYPMCIILASALCAFVLPATAQQQTPPPPAQAQQQDIEVDDTDLVTFADIYVNVQARRAEAQSEMAAAESQEEAQQLQQTAEQELVAIIEDHGWTVERYNLVANAINSDSELREQAIELINERS